MKKGFIPAILLALCASCFGGTITVLVSGQISSSTVPGVVAGNPFSGSFTYETTGVDLGSGPASQNWGFLQPQDGVTLTVDGFTFAGAGYLNMAIQDTPFNSIPDLTKDLLQVSSDGVSGTLSSNYPGLTLAFVLANFAVDPSLIPGNAIPNPFDLSKVVVPGNPNDPAIIAVHLGNFQFLGDITQVTVAPEPGVFGLVGLGLTLLVAMRKRFC
jgi:hypothetical protein